MKKSKCTLVTALNIGTIRDRMIQFFDRHKYLKTNHLWLNTIAEVRFRKQFGFPTHNISRLGTEFPLVTETNPLYFMSCNLTYFKSDENKFIINFGDKTHSGELIKIGDRIGICPERITVYGISDVGSLIHDDISRVKITYVPSNEKTVRYKVEENIRFAKDYYEMCDLEYSNNWDI